jgi:hypothetical protein
MENQQNAEKQDDTDKTIDQDLVDAKIGCTHNMLENIANEPEYP